MPSFPAVVGLGPTEIIIILVLVFVIFGAKRLPEAGRSIGHGMREFKSAVTGKGGDEDDEREKLDRPSEGDAATDEQRRSGEPARAGDTST